MSILNTKLITTPYVFPSKNIEEIIPTKNDSATFKKSRSSKEKVYDKSQAELLGDSVSKKVKKESILSEIQGATQHFKEFYSKIISLPNIQNEIKGQYDRIQEDITFKKLAIHLPSALSENFEKLCQKAQTSGAGQKKKNWNEDEISFLISIVTYYTHINGEDHKKFDEQSWKYLASIFPGRSIDQMQNKWCNLLKFYLSKDPWRPDEDEVLRSIVMSRGDPNDWKEIAQDLNMQNPSKIFRSSKQCRERWNNHIDPSVNRGPWTTEEDLRLLNLILENGKKWSQLAKEMGTRTENSVKNRWYSLMRRVGGGESNNNNTSEMTEAEEREKIVKLFSILSNDPKGETKSLSSNGNTAKDMDILLAGQTKKTEIKSRSFSKVSEKSQSNGQIRSSAFEKSSKRYKEDEISTRENFLIGDVRSLAQKIQAMNKKEKLDEVQSNLVSTNVTSEFESLAERQILNNLSYVPASKPAFVTLLPGNNFPSAVSIPSTSIQINGTQLDLNNTQFSRTSLLQSANLNSELQSRLFRLGYGGTNDFDTSHPLQFSGVQTIQTNPLANFPMLNSSILFAQQAQQQHQLKSDQNSFEIKKETVDETFNQKEKLQNLFSHLETALQKHEALSMPLQVSPTLTNGVDHIKTFSSRFEPLTPRIFEEISSQSHKYQFSLFNKEDNSVLLLDPVTSANFGLVKEISRSTNIGP